MQTYSEETTPFSSGGMFFRGVPAHPTHITHLRHALHRWLASLSLETDYEHDIVLASYEALANAVEHAYGQDDEAAMVDFEATYRPDDRHLLVRIIDYGRWRAPVKERTDSSRGHGLTLINNLSTDTVVTPTAHGTDVALHWTL